MSARQRRGSEVPTNNCARRGRCFLRKVLPLMQHLIRLHALRQLDRNLKMRCALNILRTEPGGRNPHRGIIAARRILENHVGYRTLNVQPALLARHDRLFVQMDLETRLNIGRDANIRQRPAVGRGPNVVKRVIARRRADIDDINGMAAGRILKSEIVGDLHRGILVDRHQHLHFRHAEQILRGISRRCAYRQQQKPCKNR